MVVGIIGGTGFTLDDKLETREVDTDFGKIEIGKTQVAGQKAVFVDRHQGGMPPRSANYRGQMQALEMEGVDYIIAISATGKIGSHVSPGNLVLVNTVYSYNVPRNTFFDELCAFVSLTHPFSNQLRDIAAKEAGEMLDGGSNSEMSRIYKGTNLSVGINGSGFYFHVLGNAFTEKEVEDVFRSIGTATSVVGMTLGHETPLAREMETPYFGIAVVTDYSTSRIGQEVSHSIVMEAMKQGNQAAQRLVERVVKQIGSSNLNDPAYDALEHAAAWPEHGTEDGRKLAAKLSSIAEQHPRLANYLNKKWKKYTPYVCGVL